MGSPFCEKLGLTQIVYPAAGPRTAKQDCELLLAIAIAWAVLMLKREGRHMPFSTALDRDGQGFEIFPDEPFRHDDRRASEEVLKTVRQLIPEWSLKAVAFAQNVDVLLLGSKDPQRAIRVTVCHREHPISTTWQMLYTLEGGRLIEGDVWAARHPHSLFTDGKLRPDDDIPLNVRKWGESSAHPIEAGRTGKPSTSL